MPVNPHSRTDPDWAPGSKKRKRASGQVPQTISQQIDDDDDDIEIVAVTGPTKNTPRSTPKNVPRGNQKNTPKTVAPVASSSSSKPSSSGYVTRTRTGTVTPRSHAFPGEELDDDDVIETLPPPSKRGRPVAGNGRPVGTTPSAAADPSANRRGRPSTSGITNASTPLPLPPGRGRAGVNESTPTGAPGRGRGRGRGVTPGGLSEPAVAVTPGNRGRGRRSASQQQQQQQQVPQQQHKPPPPPQPLGPFVDLLMECHEEPLSKAQQQALTEAKEKYERSQELIKAAKEGKLIFGADGTPEILEKPLPPPTRPVPPHLLPPAAVQEPTEIDEVPETAASLTPDTGLAAPPSVYPQQMYPAPGLPRPVSSPQAAASFRPPVRSSSPDLMIVAETPPKTRAGLSPLGSPLPLPPGTTPVQGTSGMGIKLPPGWTSATLPPKTPLTPLINPNTPAATAQPEEESPASKSGKSASEIGAKKAKKQTGSSGEQCNTRMRTRRNSSIKRQRKY